MDSYSFSSLSTSSSSSFSDLEAGLSDASSSGYIKRKGSYRSSPSPRSVVTAMFFCDAFSDDEPHHFLDSCFLCKKPLGRNRDIFMYRGNTPFCSEECRQEQIEMDEAGESNRKNSSFSGAVKTQQRKSSYKARSVFC